MMIYLGSDHAGYALKLKIKDYLERHQIECVDLGAESFQAGDNYPDYAKRVCGEVLSVPNSKGILICGTGAGMCVAANRYKGIRAVCPFNVRTAGLARKDEDANVLCLGGRVMCPFKAKLMVKKFLNTGFEGGRHLVRIQMLDNMQ